MKVKNKRMSELNVDTLCLLRARSHVTAPPVISINFLSSPSVSCHLHQFLVISINFLSAPSISCHLYKFSFHLRHYANLHKTNYQQKSFLLTHLSLLLLPSFYFLRLLFSSLLLSSFLFSFFPSFLSFFSSFFSLSSRAMNCCQPLK